MNSLRLEATQARSASVASGNVGGGTLWRSPSSCAHDQRAMLNKCFDSSNKDLHIIALSLLSENMDTELIDRVFILAENSYFDDDVDMALLEYLARIQNLYLDGIDRRLFHQWCGQAQDIIFRFISHPKKDRRIAAVHALRGCRCWDTH